MKIKRKRTCLKVYGIFLIFVVILFYPIFSLVVFKAPETINSMLDTKHENISFWNLRKILVADSKVKNGDYPEDVFSKKELQQGYVTLHVIGICYMFLALSIVCDEFFVPALHVISDIMAISDDVAGATFMAAGGSAPELFTSILGVFVAKSNIGFGTIVGSAVFNILFVIGMCAIFSKTLLHLTWWPLLRDSVFYSVALALLIRSFHDSTIEWWESLILFAIYLLYVTFMYFNERLETYVKQLISKCRIKDSKINPQIASGGLHYQNCTLHLVIHTLDPISEATAESKLHRFKEILKEGRVDTTKRDRYRYGREGSKLSDDGDVDLRKLALVNNYFGDNKPKRETSDCNKSSAENAVPTASHGYQGSHDASRSNSACSVGSHDRQDESIFKDRAGSMASYQSINQKQGSTAASTPRTERTVRFSGRVSKMSTISYHGMSRACLRETAAEKQGSIDEDEETPLSLEFPKTALMRIYYIIKFPIVILLFFTLPDVRRPKLRKLYPLTFLGSIIWIGGFAYLMVWWASTTGAALGIPDEVMGLTFLAAGTSIPDLITSVLVAKQGLGDMAVSSSIGSNIFDITVGLPIPWFFWSAINSFNPLYVDSHGLFCSTLSLFIMLVAVIASIAIFKWRMSKRLAMAMFVLYAIFLTLALLIEFKVFVCFF